MRPQTARQQIAEQRAFDSTMRIFARYGCDPRKDSAEVISGKMERMNVSEIETVATAQRLVMALNGVHGGMRLDS